MNFNDKFLIMTARILRDYAERLSNDSTEDVPKEWIEMFSESEMEGLNFICNDWNGSLHEPVDGMVDQTSILVSMIAWTFEDSAEKDKDFHSWLTGMCFHHGFARYGQFPGNQVFVAQYDYFEDTVELVNDLEGSDDPAIEALKKLRELEDDGNVWIESDDDPGKAMVKLTEKIKDYYYNVLNKD